MKLSLAARSLILFGVCFVVMMAHTLLESSIGRLSFGVQRLVVFLGIILPAGAGSVLGVMSLLRKEGRAWMAVIAVVLNTLFALFHLAIVLYAG